SIALAPADSPSSPGSAKGFLVIACMIAPDTAKAAPTNTAPISLGTRILRITLDCSVLLLEKSANQTSNRVVFVAPYMIEIINMTINNKQALIIFVRND